MADLAVGEQQRVEIARLLYRGVKVLILDEPTAVLTPQETTGLFDNVRRLAGEGHAIVIVTHKLSEVLAVADTVTVMRGGRVVANGRADQHTAASLARLMVGRQVDSVVVSPSLRAADGPAGTADLHEVLRVKRLSVAGSSHAATV